MQLKFTQGCRLHYGNNILRLEDCSSTLRATEPSQVPTAESQTYVDIQGV
jgi:hypothetical protein